MASFGNHILAPFSPLHWRLRETGSGNDSESDSGRGSAAVALAAAGGTGEAAAGMGGVMTKMAGRAASIG